MTALATGQDLGGRSALGATEVFWADATAGEIRAVPRAGGAVRRVAAEACGTDVAATASHVYWKGDDGYCPAAPGLPLLRRAPVAGGAVEAVFEEPLAVVADGDAVLFADFEVVYRLDGAGIAPVGDYSAIARIPLDQSSWMSYGADFIAATAGDVYVAGNKGVADGWVARAAR